MRDLRLELREIANNNTIYSDAARYLLSYNGDYHELKISKISTETFSSTATITRLAQQLGLSGFSELKILLSNESKYDNEVNKTLEDYKQMISKTVEDTLFVVDYQSLIVAGNVLYNADKIGLFGVGGSKIVLEDFYAKLLRLGLNVNNELDLHFQHVVASNMSENDVAVVVTYSGYTKDVLKLVDKLKVNNVKIIVVSANEALESVSDIFLQVSKTENYSRVYSLTSKMSLQVILDFLFIELLNNNPLEFENIMNKTQIEK